MSGARARLSLAEAGGGRRTSEWGRNALSIQPAGFGDKVAFVWKVADKLRGHFTSNEYGSVMLPLLATRRLKNAAGPYA